MFEKRNDFSNMAREIVKREKEAGGYMAMEMSANIGRDRQGAGGWQQKAASGKEGGQIPVNQQMLEWYYRMREEGRRGESKEEYAARVYAKLQMGKELTPDELSFLARTDPVMYQKALRVQAMRKMLENNLKSCKSKEEAQEVFSRAVSGISDKDPDKGMLVAALKDVYMEFTKSDAYKRLPEKKEDGKKGSQGGMEFDVDESGYQVVFAKGSAGNAFVAKG